MSDTWVDIGPGHENHGQEGVGAVFLDLTPSSRTCACKCPDGPCEHVWDGEWADIYFDGTCQSVTCSRCGMDAMSHDMRVAP